MTFGYLDVGSDPAWDFVEDLDVLSFGNGRLLEVSIDEIVCGKVDPLFEEHEVVGRGEEDREEEDGNQDLGFGHSSIFDLDFDYSSLRR